MGCAEQTIRLDFPVWTDGTTTAIFIPLFRTTPQKFAQLRFAYDMESIAGSPTWAGAWRGSFDGGATFTGSSNIQGTPTWSTAAGWYWDGTWYDLPLNIGNLIEVGLYLKNSSGTTRAMGRVSIIADLRGA